MTNTVTISISSISLTGLLGIVFIALKLSHVIDWSWWWVLTPFWLPTALTIAITIIIITIMIVVLIAMWLFVVVLDM